MLDFKDASIPDKQSCTFRRMDRPIQRIEKLLLERGLKPREVRSALADICGISYQAVAQWFTEDTKQITAGNLSKIANYFGTTVEYLLTGTESPPTYLGVSENKQIIGKLVPVIDWASVAVALQGNNAHPSDMAVGWRPCPVDHGPRTFILEVPDDSMTASGPQEKSYPKGCMVVVDPDAEEPGANKPVLARLPDGSVTLRLLMKDAGRRWLRAINPVFLPIVDIPFEIVGTIKLKMEEP